MCPLGGGRGTKTPSFENHSLFKRLGKSQQTIMKTSRGKEGPSFIPPVAPSWERQSGPAAAHVSGQERGMSAPTVSIPEEQGRCLCRFRKYRGTERGEKKRERRRGRRGKGRKGGREETRDPKIQPPNLGVI